MFRATNAALLLALLAGCDLTEPHVVACGDDCPGVSESGSGGAGGAADGGAGQGTAGSGGRPDGGSGGRAGQGTAGSGGRSDGGSGAGGQGVAGIDGGTDAGDCASCLDNAPHCNAGACVECTDDDHCENGVCEDFSCVACRSDADCTDVAAARCSDNQCVPCFSANDCAHFEDAQICDQGTCVQCTATDSSACGTSPALRQYVCDVLARTCSMHERGSAGLCDPCVSDEQCGAGQLCVMQRFDEVGDDPDEGDIDVGYFCFWREDATEAGAPNGTCAGTRPYVATLADSVSIGGVEAPICGLRVTTCAAYKDYNIKACAGPEDDAACGDSRFASDGYCEVFMSSMYFCTTPCLGPFDCRTGSTCSSSTTPEYCSL